MRANSALPHLGHFCFTVRRILIPTFYISSSDYNDRIDLCGTL
jgi:hypothetical protein